MRRHLPVALLLLAANARAAEGVIVGRLSKPETVARVFAVDRSQIDRNAERAARIVPLEGTVAADGAFRVPVPVGKRVDLVMEYRDGSRVEGVNLAVKRSDFVEEDPPLSRPQADKVRAVARSLNKFENEVDFLAIAGNAQHAVALLNKRRTTPFFASQPGEIVWRLEVWRFERPENADYWVKSQDELFEIIVRERLQRSKYDARNLTLDPKLGGLTAAADKLTLDVGIVESPEPTPGIRLRNGPVPLPETSPADDQP